MLERFFFKATPIKFMISTFRSSTASSSNFETNLSKFAHISMYLSVDFVGDSGFCCDGAALDFKYEENELAINETLSESWSFLAFGFVCI